MSRARADPGLPVRLPMDLPTEEVRRRRAGVVTAISVAVLVLIPLVPGALRPDGALAVVGIPVEALVVVLFVVCFRGRPWRTLAAAIFAALVVAALVVALLDLGFRAMIDRPFSLAEDAGAIVAAYGVVADAMGPLGAVSVVAVICALLVLAAVALTRAALRVGGAVRNEGRRGRIALAALAATWIVCSIGGAQLAPGAPVAASRSVDALVESSERALSGMREQEAFESELASDALGALRPGELLTGLAGKDVVIAFVESYGRVAVEPAGFTDGIRRVLADGEASMARTGYTARSGFLSSPTFGGVSWLAHATLQSGAWVDSQPKYERLLARDRMTLSGAFDAAGWYTMAVVPSNDREWEAGKTFYGFDAILDARTMGYRGPAFGYARMPDQFTWKAFHEHRAAAGSSPVMAEIDLVSSHTPWTPLPRLLPWDELGDGSVFRSQSSEAESPMVAWSDRDRARELYADSVEYSLSAMFSYLETFEQSELVLVVVGDHQPARIVSGPAAGPDVPISIITKDPGVIAGIESWGWDQGVRPTASAPVWRMDEFRDRFVEAFSG